MKIQHISPYHQLYRSNIASFGLFGFSKKQKQAPDRVDLSLSQAQKSDQGIKSLTSKIEKDYRELTQDAKHFFREYEAIINAGAAYGYSGTIPYLEENNVNITFGEIDELSQLPKKCIIWENGRPQTIYKLLCNEPYTAFISEQYPDRDTVISCTILGDKLASCTEQNKSTGQVKRFLTQKDGFIYTEGTIKPQETVAHALTEYNCSKNKTKSIFARLEHGEKQRYKYNPKKKMWLEVK